MAASRGTLKIGRKTLLAVIDHITQVLPGPDKGYVAPLLQDYVKALTEVLSRQSNVELLYRKEGAPWDKCVDFFLDIALHILPEEAVTSTSSLSRASPAPTGTTLRSTAGSNGSVTLQKRNGQGEGGSLRDVLEGIHNLLSAANAPVLRRAKEISNIAMRILQIKHLSLGSMQTLCFSIINSVFSATEADELDDSTCLVKKLLPLMGYWWRSEKVSQDELIKGLRNEISKSIFLMHLHIKHLAINAWDVEVRHDLENLIDPLWQEYSKRSEAFRLQLGDITFTPSNLPKDSMRLLLFGLRPHNLEGESNWAFVQNLALLEAILLRPKKSLGGGEPDSDDPPPKKKRQQHGISSLRMRMKSNDAGIVRTSLQLVPFVLATNSLGPDDIGELFSDLVTLAGDKNTITASWAFVACARYSAPFFRLHHDY